MKLNHTELESFFYGTLLGDSYIYRSSFMCKQITKSLIYFKKKIIEQFLPGIKVSVTEHEAYTDKNGVNHQKYYQLTTNTHEYIKKLDKIFYTENDHKKIYPINTITKLTPLGFAMWYADDGTTVLVGLSQNGYSAKDRRIQICTDSFSLDEHKTMIEEFKKINITSKIIDRHRNNQHRIGISIPKGGQQLMCDIEKYFYYFPEMLYKLDLGYRKDSLLKRQYVSKEYNDLFLRISAHESFIDRMKDRVI